MKNKNLAAIAGLIVLLVILLLVQRPSDSQILYEKVIEQGQPNDISTTLNKRIGEQNIVLEVDARRFYIEIDDSQVNMTILMDESKNFTDITKTQKKEQITTHVSNADLLESLSREQQQLIDEANHRISLLRKELG
ncbi:MAG: hypothetical protein ACK4NC_02045 [Candidatus Gracilibacteria bacterium]